MPRKQSVPRSEIAIGQRIREVREALNLSRTQLAKKIGIDSARLVNYELGRALAPYGVADSIAREACISQRWLATGLSPRDHYFRVYEPLAAALPPRLPFSLVYAKALSPLIEQSLRVAAQNSGSPVELLESWELRTSEPLGTPTDLAHMAEDESFASISALAAILPPELRLRFFHTLRKTASDFMKTNREASRRYATQKNEVIKAKDAALIKTVLAGLEG